MPIQVEHLTHTYLPGSPFSSTAIHDLSLSIEDGEFIGVLGHTGSGKTTFVMHLNGLLKPTEGRVIVDGTDITRKGVSLLDVRKKVGLVFQYPEYQLFEETVAKDVAFGPRNMGLSREEIDARVAWALAQVGWTRPRWPTFPPSSCPGADAPRRHRRGAGHAAPHPHPGRATAGLDPARPPRHTGYDPPPARRKQHDGDHVSHSMDDIATLATRLWS
jgi:energy-coupling factor transport system ATP-binding protein